MHDHLKRFSEASNAHAMEYKELKDEWESEEEHTPAECMAYLCDMVCLLHKRHECLANLVMEHMHVYHGVPRENVARSTVTHVG